MNASAPIATANVPDIENIQINEEISIHSTQNPVPAQPVPASNQVRRLGDTTNRTLNISMGPQTQPAYPLIGLLPHEHALNLNRLYNASCSLKNYGVKLLEYYFTRNELIDPNVNERGQTVKGSDKVMSGLDPQRLELIKNNVLSYKTGSEDEKLAFWRGTHRAMNAKMAELKMKYGRREFN